MLMEIHVAHTQGFCAGVAYALNIVDLTLKKFGVPLYVRHEIVHNTSVIEDYKSQGVIFIDELDEVPDNSTVIFSAHGTAPHVFEEAKKRGLKYIDATCPLVTKVHRYADRFSQRNVQTVLIGHKGHQELIGTSGYVRQDLLHIVQNVSDVDNLNIDPQKPVGFLTQTTLSVQETGEIISKLREKYPHIEGASKADICYATTNRQNAVIELAKVCDIVIICGSPASSNSNRLRETAAKFDVPSYIIDFPNDFDISLLKGKKRVGVSSGASVPQKIVDGLILRIQDKYPNATVHQKDSVEKDIEFPLPKSLKEQCQTA
ncbi:MAG: 4-hydroxy-3-methylbut-2-enyl diphosphate reductase [Candidatus Margulisbacteria bacterium]|nr:4-hydroxy-3-methylbut-2-enyl diphosphate reductase [Candidatus Margulisiibacteriota bacterium]